MMNSTLRNALSLESSVSLEEENPEKVEAEVEEAVTEVVEAGAEADKADVEQEELERAHASMESIYVALEAAGENGLSQESAAGYSLAAQVVLGDALPNPVSLEGYGDDAVAATQLSLESVGDVIKKIWNAIKTAVQKSIKAIGEFFKKMFSGVEKLKKRIDGQLDTISKLKKDGAEAKEAKVKISAHEKLQWKGKFDASTLEGGAKFVAGQADNSLFSTARKVGAMFKSIVDTFKKKVEDAEKASEVLIEMEKDITDDLGKVDSEFPGGVKMVTETEADTGVLLSFSIEDAKVSYKGDGEIETPSLDVLETALKEVSKLTDELAKGKKEIELVNRLRDDAIKSAGKWAKDVEKSDGEDYDQKAVKKLLKRTNSKLANQISKTARYVFNYTRSVSSAAKDTLAVYEAK